MRALRVVLITAALFFLALLAVRELPQRYGPILLARFGLSDTHLEGLQVTAGSLAIANISATLSRPSGPLGISLTGVACSFNLPDLLHGRVAACSTKTATVRLLPFDNGQPQGSLPDLVGMLHAPPALKKRIGQLEVERILVLRPEASPAQAAMPLRLTWTTTEGAGRLVVNTIPSPSGTAGAPLLAVHVAGDLLTGQLSLPPAVLSALLPTIFTGKSLNTIIRAEWKAELSASGDRPLHLLLTVANLRTPQVEAAEVTLRLDGATTADRSALTLKPTSSLLVKNGRGQGWECGQLELNLAGTIVTAPDKWQVHLKPAHPWLVDGLGVGTKHFARMRLAITGFAIGYDAHAVQATASVSLPAHPDSLQADLRYQSAGERLGAFSLKTTQAIALHQAGNPMALLTRPAVPFVLEKGALNFSSQLSWSDKSPPTLRLALDLQDGNGRIAEIPFSGLDVHQELQLLPMPTTRATGTITLRSLLGPIPLTNLRIAAEMQAAPAATPVCKINDATAELLGGTVESRDCEYDLGRGEGTCLLTVSGFDIEQLLAAQQVKNLAATGRLAGQLPLRVDPTGIRIDQGRLANVTEGFIRYQPDTAPAPGSPLSDYALKALEEFRYHSLVALVDYLTDGELHLRLELQGKSPNLDPKRPVHLNINAQQNLRSLLKSLHYRSTPDLLQSQGR